MINPVKILGWGDKPPLFVRLLAAEAAATNRTKAGERVGISRTAVSLVLVNKYSSPSTAGVERRVLEVLGRIECPALDEAMNVTQCLEFSQRSAPTHNPAAMQHWRVCQQCPNNPNCGGNGYATVH